MEQHEHKEEQKEEAQATQQHIGMHQHKAEARHKKENSLNLRMVSTILMIVVAIVLIFNFFTLYQINGILQEKMLELKELSIPAKVEIYILNSGCDDCFNLAETLSSVRGSGVNITKEETYEPDSQEAASLIRKYSIEKLPAVVVTGEVEKAKKLGSYLKLADDDSAFILRSQKAPYVDASTKAVVGYLIFTIINEEPCDNCTDLTLLADNILSFVNGVSKGTKILKSNETQAKQLIAKYNITKLPAMIISKDASAYQEIVDTWESIGTVESDGSYVLREITPPYYDIAQKKIRGWVTVTMINDSSCAECYDVSTHILILSNYGVVFEEEKILDVSSKEAKSLTSKYNITSVPTMVLTGDPAVYPALAQIWQSVGTVEDDGTYIFRKLSVMKGSYRDLSTGEVISPESSE